LNQINIVCIFGIIVGIVLVLAGIDGSFTVWGCVPPSNVTSCGGTAPWLYVYALDLFFAGIVFIVSSFGGLIYFFWGRRR